MSAWMLWVLAGVLAAGAACLVAWGMIWALALSD